MKKTDTYIWCFGVFLFSITLKSCASDDIINSEIESIPQYSLVDDEKKNPLCNFKPEPFTFVVGKKFSDDKVRSEPCELTDFGKILQGYFLNLLEDPYFEVELINYYSELNRKYVTYYEGDNYYGANGEYNQLAKKRIRDLEKFWKLDRNIRLNGEHTTTLNDREVLTDMIESFDRSVRNRNQAYDKADRLLSINEKSDEIPENPYFAMDAFTRSNGVMVIGDGLLESLTALGFDGEIVFTAILSHEWWHQAQFEHSENWDYTDQLTSESERARFSELEADFAAAYYLTHKRGANYNWKKIEEYFALSFNVGDCLISSNQHHGTPDQRLEAAKLGYELADSAHKKGSILSPELLHLRFINKYLSLPL